MGNIGLVKWGAFCGFRCLKTYAEYQPITAMGTYDFASVWFWGLVSVFYWVACDILLSVLRALFS